MGGGSKAKALAALPAPYNTADLSNGESKFALCSTCHSLDHIAFRNLADQCFEQVLERDDPRRSTKLVNHDREMLPLALHVQQHIAGRSKLRGE